MANIKSAIKRIRSNARKQEHNRITRGRVRSAVKTARTAMEGGAGADTEAKIKTAISELDRAAGKGLIHKNNAARRKSRLMKKLNQAKQTTTQA